MIVAVTGSSGFIGRRLVAKLLSYGHRVIELDITEGFDILDWEMVKKVEKFDVLVHLAGFTFVPLSYKRPRDFYSLNISGVINSLELCRIHEAKFIFVSSYVYGIPEYLPIDESHVLAGFNPYAETKIIGEKICENYNKYFNVRSIILRPFNIYGPGQNDNFLIPLILKQAESGVVNLLDPHPKRDFVYVDDVAEAFIKAVESEKIDFDIFNIGSGRSYSVDDVVNQVNSLYNNKLEIHYSNIERDNEVLDTIADISKIKDVLGWQPVISFKEGLEKTIVKLNS